MDIEQDIDIDKEKIIEALYKNTPLLKQYQNELETNWDEVLQNLEKDLKDYYINYLNDYKPENLYQFILFYFFLFSGIFYLNINYLDKNYIELGKKINILENPLLKQKKFEWNRLEVYSIFPMKSEQYLNEVFKKDFFPFLRKVILNDTVFLETNIYDFIENTINYIEQKSKPYLEKGIPITLTHFKFENLEKYIDYLKNLGIYNFVLEIDKYIRSKLKKRDLLIILSYNSFLVMSIGARKEIIYERFKDIYIEVKNVVLDYHFYIENLLGPEDSLKEILFKLKI